jgi:acyl-CoA thioester hydrolase
MRAAMTDLPNPGRFEGKTHILPIRIYYEDTDLSGVVYHANYLRFMERARSEYFYALGVKVAGLDEPEPTAWTLRKVELEYILPARVGDVIEVHTKAITLTGVRMSAEQSIYRDGVLLMRGFVLACIVTLSGKPRRIPQDIRDKLLPFLYET